MCGRYRLRRLKEWLDEFSDLKISPSLDFLVRDNISPTQNVPAVRWNHGALRAELLRWGLIPSWAKDKAIGNKLFNARAETIAEKPSFRKAFQSRRCLIPADGFYEWQAIPGSKRKQPYYIHRKDDRLLAFAGIWEQWEAPDGIVESCSIITTEANDVVKPIHDRMPVIINRENYLQWLDPQTPIESLGQQLTSYPAEIMSANPVTSDSSGGTSYEIRSFLWGGMTFPDGKRFERDLPKSAKYVQRPSENFLVMDAVNLPGLDNWPIRQSNHGAAGINIGYCDGHVTFTPTGRSLVEAYMTGYFDPLWDSDFCAHYGLIRTAKAFSWMQQ